MSQILQSRYLFLIHVPTEPTSNLNSSIGCEQSSVWLLYCTIYLPDKQILQPIFLQKTITNLLFLAVHVSTDITKLTMSQLEVLFLAAM
ncbi:hypothetical protein GDO78_002964 [Eleutherodactylus coqui]|uniref:Uncharacterized protein n=1 Tax=Eleutherodactylus coqui TaxID=57060 RepID=A0A8J6EWS6_ELECQ|nr:hypothetical protein GDO78_002964 [Eleutherodactylus coqui]